MWKAKLSDLMLSPKMIAPYPESNNANNITSEAWLTSIRLASRARPGTQNQGCKLTFQRRIRKFVGADLRKSMV